jgi:hypothetical protein
MSQTSCPDCYMSWRMPVCGLSKTIIFFECLHTTGSPRLFTNIPSTHNIFGTPLIGCGGITGDSKNLSTPLIPFILSLLTREDQLLLTVSCKQLGDKRNIPLQCLISTFHHVWYFHPTKQRLERGRNNVTQQHEAALRCEFKIETFIKFSSKMETLSHGDAAAYWVT